MSDLHDKARALLAGPKCYPLNTGRTVYTPDFMRHLEAMTQEGLYDKGNIAEQLAYRDQIIADLLAENERLLTDLQQANATTLKAINQRMDAEARLRALCEQEPVAWQFMREDGIPGLSWRKRDFGIALIPRPSMES